MKKILIISPHFPPSNLAAVHRSRLFAQHLPSFNWEPTILTVDEKYYEETLDYNLVKLLPAGLKIEKVKAFKVTKPRLIGDIGMRAFFQLYRRAKQIIRTQKIDFLYIPIPSFYAALLGRWLYVSTGVKYGIDYIDPWVHQFPDRTKLRHRLSEGIAKFLEPIAVRNASLITGVAEGYYQGVRERNPLLAQTCVFGAMPYGGEKRDHEVVSTLDIKPYLFAPNNKIQLVYAGAMLPKAYEPLEAIFKSIEQNIEKFSDLEIHFIGTGKSPDDPNGYNIKPYAEKYRLWEKVIFEYPKRIPYLDVLVHLDAANGVFILGSTEPHYTPSKVYQGVLSGKPILAVLHEASTALKVINTTNSGVAYPLNPYKLQELTNEFPGVFDKYLMCLKTFDPKQVKQEDLQEYSAYSVTQKLAGLINKAIDNRN
ncbi:MAG: hypothetical protein JST82_17110 [Bacteroidetes bacterium]|nr:hypothetical protein [Bacteroidota bacterium]